MDDDNLASVLFRRLRRRGVNMRCVACDWTMDGPVGDYELVPASDAHGVDGRDGTDGTSLHRVKLKVFACRNCGYIRLHSASVLHDITDGRN